MVVKKKKIRNLVNSEILIERAEKTNEPPQKEDKTEDLLKQILNGQNTLNKRIGKIEMDIYEEKNEQPDEDPEEEPEQVITNILQEEPKVEPKVIPKSEPKVVIQEFPKEEPETIEPSRMPYLQEEPKNRKDIVPQISAINKHQYPKEIRVPEEQNTETDIKPQITKENPIQPPETPTNQLEIVYKTSKWVKIVFIALVAILFLCILYIFIGPDIICDGNVYYNMTLK